MENSNPTIVNAADLPTRKPADAGTVPGGGGGGSGAGATSLHSKPDIYDGTIFALSISSYAAALNDPFAAGDVVSDAQSDAASSEEDNEENVLEEPIDEQEIYDLIATIADPEHPISLGALAVVSLQDIHIAPSLPTNPSSPLRTVTVLITPTITHCSLATVIGLGVRVRLEQSLPPRFRVDVRIKEGTHSTADEANKQLADKERVAAALENGALMGVIGKMLETCQ